MSDHDSVTPTRREMWLRIALATAQGMPAPQQVRFGPREFHLPYVTLQFDRHDEARRWAEYYETSTRVYDRPDLGNRYVEGEVRIGDLRVMIVGVEPLPSESELKLAAQVAAAVLTPDAELTPVATPDAVLMQPLPPVDPAVADVILGRRPDLSPAQQQAFVDAAERIPALGGSA